MLNRRNLLTAGAALAVSVLTVAPRANAVPVASGAPAVPLFGTTAAARPDLAGTVVADVIRPFSLQTRNASLTGWVQDRVVRSNKTGTLDFYYRVYLDNVSGDAISKVLRSSFDPAGTSTDCDWRVDGLGLRVPLSVQRSSDGETLQFYHFGANSIMPGEESRFVFVKTRAKNYSLGEMTLCYEGIRGPGDISLPAFQPEY